MIAKFKMSGWKSALRRPTNERSVRLKTHGCRKGRNSTAANSNLHCGLIALDLDTWKRTHLSIGLMFFRQFIGINALAYNISILMSTLRASYHVQVALPVILGSVHFLGALSCLWAIDTVGRKRLLVYGSSVMLVCLIIIAGLNSQFSYDWASHQDAAWICVGFSILGTLAFGATWSPISWALPAEIFPGRLRAKGSALSACSYWL
jgi:MFS family permease